MLCIDMRRPGGTWALVLIDRDSGVRCYSELGSEGPFASDSMSASEPGVADDNTALETA